MAEFLVEVYVAHDDRSAAQQIGRAAQTAADPTNGARCLRSIHVPEDETCFLLYEAHTATDVADAVRRAGLTPEHISATASSQPPPTDTKGTTVSITTTTTTTTHSELRDKQQKVWSSGDYNKIAALTIPLSEVLVDRVGIGPGDRVLDVATGTGHAALAAARRGAVVTGTDYVPALLDIARRRADAEDVVADFAEADAESQPYADGTFDFVLSAIGVMFSADHQQAARELVRVCRPGGTIGLASWTPEGFVGQLLGTVGRHAAPPPGAQPPTRWGVEETVADLLGDGVTDVASTTRTVTQRFSDAEEFADLFLTFYGPTFAAAGRLDDAGKAALRADMTDLARTFDRGDGDGVVTEWEYRIVTATRR